MRKSLLFIAAILIAMTASAQVSVRKATFEKRVLKNSSIEKKIATPSRKLVKSPTIKDEEGAEVSVYYYRPNGMFYGGLDNTLSGIGDVVLAPAGTYKFDCTDAVENADEGLVWTYYVLGEQSWEEQTADATENEAIDVSYENLGMTLSPLPTLTGSTMDGFDIVETSYSMSSKGALIGYGTFNGLPSVNYNPGIIFGFNPWSNGSVGPTGTVSSTIDSWYGSQGVANANITKLGEYFYTPNKVWFESGQMWIYDPEGVVEADDIDVRAYALDDDGQYYIVGDEVAAFSVSEILDVENYIDGCKVVKFTCPLTEYANESGNGLLVMFSPAEGSEVNITPVVTIVESTEKDVEYCTTGFCYGSFEYNGTAMPEDIYFSADPGWYLDASRTTVGYGTTLTLGLDFIYDEPEGINTVSAAKKADNSIYSISGVKVSNGSQKGLATGVYVQNGKKIVIK